MESTVGMAKTNVERAREGAHDTVERSAYAAQSAVDQLAVKGEHWRAQAAELKLRADEALESARGYVREHPVQALGIAVAAGYLLSLITRSRR